MTLCICMYEKKFWQCMYELAKRFLQSVGTENCYMCIKLKMNNAIYINMVLNKYE